MAKPTSPIEFSSFSKGLNTDSSQLNYQPDSAQVLKNYVLNLDGSIQRRNGRTKILQDMSSLDLEYQKESELDEDFILISDYVNNRNNLKWYKWTNLGSNGDTEILVLSHAKGRVSFFIVGDRAIEQIPFNNSTDKLAYATLDVQSGAPEYYKNNSVDFSQIGSTLVVVNGTQRVQTYNYNQSSNEIREGEATTLQVRDVWGILSDNQQPSQGRDYFPYYRPYEDDFNSDIFQKAGYLYGLMNKGWGTPFLRKDGDSRNDPVHLFLSLADRYPSNSDLVYNAVYPNTSAPNPTVDRFHPQDSIDSPYPKSEAPLGAFIIDLFDRKYSRREAAKNVTDEPVFEGATSQWLLNVNDINGDWVQFGGPTCTASYAGRVWYSGISDEGLVNGNSSSPNLSKLVLFSQLSSSSSTIGRCYQEGDPTNPDNSDIVDTDGGFIPIQEVGTIYRLVPHSNSLLVIASNGVWEIRGTSDSGFTATSYKVDKVSEYGCESVGSVVVTKVGVMYLSKSGIINISQNEYGTMEDANISQSKIANKLSTFTNLEKSTFKGCYDEVKDKVIWNFLTQSGAEELVLDLNLGSFYTHVWDGYLTEGSVLPVMSIPLKEPLTGLTENLVVVGVDDVLVGGEQAVIGEDAFNYSGVTTLNIIQQVSNGKVCNGFALEFPNQFYDWPTFETQDGSWTTPNPTDALGEVVTGALTGGDTQRYKQVPYITMHMRRTESGFEEVGDDLIPLGQSSCLVQPQWEWTDSAASGRWGREFQAYRYNKFYMPVGSGDDYDTGQSVITTKNKLRGKGRALSLRFSTEEGKNSHILGWALNIGINNVV